MSLNRSLIDVWSFRTFMVLMMIVLNGATVNSDANFFPSLIWGKVESGGDNHFESKYKRTVFFSGSQSFLSSGPQTLAEAEL